MCGGMLLPAANSGKRGGFTTEHTEGTEEEEMDHEGHEEDEI